MELPYEQEAMHGCRMPDGLTQWEQYAYLSIRFLYRQYRAGAIDCDTVAAEKRKIAAAARRAKEEAEFQKKMTASTVDLWRTIEAAGSKYAKDPTPEHAAAFYKAVYGVGRKHGRLEELETAP